MPLLRRPASALEQEAATARVRGLLLGQGGWTLPPEDEAPEPAGSVPTEVPRPAQDVLPGAAGLHVAAPSRPSWAQEPGTGAAPAEVSRGPAHVAPGLLDRLRAGRLDPGRRAVVGLVVVGVLACLLAGLLVLRSAPQEVALPVVESAGVPVEGATLPSASAAPAAPAGEVVVAVAGEVRKPGLVRLPAGSRVDDALRAAGGLQPGAAVGLLNLARKVVDGEQVLVGVEAPPGAPDGPAPGAGAPAAGGAAPGAAVDLNTATAADLDRLPGIGPVLAQRVVDHRTANGPFRSVDQLREVSGIGEAKYASLRDLVRV